MAFFNTDSLRRWFSSGPADRSTVSPGTKRIRTDISATVFSGTPELWVKYLNIPPEERALEGEVIHLNYDSYRHHLGFDGAGSLAGHLAQYLQIAWERGVKQLEELPEIRHRLEMNIFGNLSNEEAPIRIRFSPAVPADATREIRMSGDRANEIAIVLRHDLAEKIASSLGEVPHSAGGLEILGRSWPLLSQILAELILPSRPRDRFIEKIRTTSELSIITLNVLFDGKKMGQLIPNKAGEIFLRHISEKKGIPIERLHDDDPFCRLLEQIGFLHYRDLTENDRRVVSILVRDYLDNRYIRLSLAGVMPDTHPKMRAMPYEWKKGRKISVPKPVTDRYGILAKDDLKAWKKVFDEFDDLGYTLIRQLGMGDFGRVYEAVNRNNSSLPGRVAIKVDRLNKGNRKQCIAEVDTILKVGNKLAASPHVIRIHDAGTLKKGKYTYHIIQHVDGDTLDHLLSIAGMEHSSLHRPDIAGATPADVSRRLSESLSGSTGERWRRMRASKPFTSKLTLPQLLDILTSILLWLEECHSLGFAIHDLKNGNLMINRNGQLKGIDLDSYAPAFSPLDKMADFVFLSVAFLMLYFNAAKDPGEANPLSHHVLSDPAALRKLFDDQWPFESINERSGGRVSDEAIRMFFRDLVLRARTNLYGNEPGLFSSDIERLIRLKRLAFFEETVLD